MDVITLVLCFLTMIISLFCGDETILGLEINTTRCVIVKTVSQLCMNIFITLVSPFVSNYAIFAAKQIHMK